ncbi:MAG TPA: hypothetical protein DEP84_32350 [Chloroflexi bacterium]|nr:hypothetical protein [Chloroflexota bacterium]
MEMRKAPACVPLHANHTSGWRRSLVLRPFRPQRLTPIGATPMMGVVATHRKSLQGCCRLQAGAELERDAKTMAVGYKAKALSLSQPRAILFGKTLRLRSNGY